jgi:hypothetical protein
MRPIGSFFGKTGKCTTLGKTEEFASKKSSKKLFLRGICEQIVQRLQNNFHI